MISGCYVLDLYCDLETEDADDHHGWNEFPKQYTSEFGAKARAAARRNGWQLDLKNSTAICPKCTKLGRKLPEKYDASA